MNVYISIGNSDDKLSQARWAAFWSLVNINIRAHAKAVHGAWLSLPNSGYQNACWCIEPQGNHTRFRNTLRDIAQEFEQDSITWAEVSEVTFLSHTNEKGYIT